VGFVVPSTIIAIVAQAALTTSICASIVCRCEAATGSPDSSPPAMCGRPCADVSSPAGFVAALLTAAVVAGLSAIVVAIEREESCSA